MHTFTRALAGLAVCSAITFAGCGGGGGGGGGSSAPPPPNPLYVRTIGNDANSGGSPEDALGTILQAAQLARNGYTIVVGPGTYRESVTTDRAGQVPQGVRFFADIRGTLTGDDPGPVLVQPRSGSGFNISNTGPVTVGGRVVNPIIDSFTVEGANGVGINISGGSNFTIQSCVVTGAADFGIRVGGTADALVLNNLVYDNAGSIAVVQGAKNAQLINNTIALNEDRGITVGNSAEAAPGVVIHNNIIQGNSADEAIKDFPPGDATYMGGFNLVLPDFYNPMTLRSNKDIHADARFVSPPQGDFHLLASSPALNVGLSQNDLTTVDPLLVGNGTSCMISTSSKCVVKVTDYLHDRTASGGNACDQGALDLGFHTPPVTRCTGG